MVIASVPSARELAARTYCRLTGWDMSPEFEAALLPRPREKWVSGGWQAGKSVEGHCEIGVSIAEKFPRLDFGSQEQNLYRAWVVVPSYTAPKKEMDYLLQSLTRLGIVSGHRFQEGSSSMVSLFGGRGVIETRTAQDPESIAGEPCDDVLVVEAGQMPEIIRTQAQGRIITRRGNITYTGTLEDDEAKPRYVWYAKAVADYLDRPTEDMAAFSLPSHANRTVFPTGRLDPEIVRQEAILGPHAFSRRILGIPQGSQYPVYPVLATVPEMFSAYGVTGHDDWIASMGAIGHDYGLGEDGKAHPTTLAAVTVNAMNEAWVREVRRNYSGDTTWIEANRRELSARYRIPLHRTGYDAMQKEAAEYGRGMVALGPGTRGRKVGLVEARLNTRKLWFDLNGPGVRDALAQMGRVHYVKKQSPEKGAFFEYARVDDDDAAGVENAVWVIDHEGSSRWDASQLAGLAPALGPLQAERVLR